MFSKNKDLQTKLNQQKQILKETQNKIKIAELKAKNKVNVQEDIRSLKLN